MSWTKRELISAAFDELGLGAYNFDLSEDQIDSALRKLDSLMATWNARGLRLGYPLPSSPSNSNVDTDSNVPDSAIEAIYLNLSIRLAPSYGKVVSNETRTNAKNALNNLYNLSTTPVERQITDLPRGSGQKYWRDASNPFLPDTEDPLLAGQDGELNFN